MRRIGKITRSGYKMSDAYSELDAALLSGDSGRACCMAVELACSGGGQARKVTAFLIDTYCARCVNSGRAQLSMLCTSLAYIGDGTPRSPDDGSIYRSDFRRGLCSLVLLVGSVSPTRNLNASFVRVQRAKLPCSIAKIIEELKASVHAGDARAVSCIVRTMADDSWCDDKECASGLRMPDVQRLHTSSRRDPLWRIWESALEMGIERGVSEYVENCMHAFAWAYNSTTRNARIHLLWYAFLVVVKGAPRRGPHPIDLDVFEHALGVIDAVYEEILESDPHATNVTSSSSRCAFDAVAAEDAEDAVTCKDRMGYLSLLTRCDVAKTWEVEKDQQRKAASASASASTLVDCDTKTVVVGRQAHRRSDGHPLLRQ